MPFVGPITIKEAVESIHRKNYLLPSIQREFVWSTEQIEMLFDSLMRDYPINSFLFWEVENNSIENYQFYEFIQNYHDRNNRHNPKASLNGEKDIVAILDGQQRLTSLYIGLKGTYAYKLPRKRWDNDSAFPKRILYLNLLYISSEDNDVAYEFSFLTEKESEERDQDHFWFKVGKILDFSEPGDMQEYLFETELVRCDKGREASKTLFKLYDVIHNIKSINFFLERDKDLDKVLNIFIRVNNGGTKLSYSDLLLSIATAQWKEKDAREAIISFVDDINAIGDGFSVTKDFVLKCCLVLSDFKEIAFKVDNFNTKNMLFIESQWDSITKAIQEAVSLVANFGYQRDTLTSYNALIPIAYYLKKIGSPANFSESKNFNTDRKKIFKWLILVLLKRTFGGQPDNILRPIREAISIATDGFPFDDIVEKLKGSPKALSFGEDEIDSLLDYKYGEPYTYSTLAFLYPTLDFRNKFHQDHIFPKKNFTRNRLKKEGVAEEDIEFFLENFNRLANLQLLEGVPNREKSGRDFAQWLSEQFPNKAERRIYMEKNFIPDVDLSFVNFREFFTEREKLIELAFKELLAQEVV